MNSSFFQKFIDEEQNSKSIIFFWIALFLLLTTALQLFVPYPIDDDTAYHFSVGRLIAKYGILRSFPWTTFSTQLDHYADKEFLFHLLFAPLSPVDYVTAARIVGIFCGTLILVGLYLILRAEKVKYAGVWALLPLTCSEFVFRFALVRPHLLSITLALILLWAYAGRRLPLLAAVAVLYPLSYVAFWQIPLILALAVETAGRLSDQPHCWKRPVVLLGGLAAGVGLHPNTINLLHLNWIHMSDILFQNAWGRRAGFDNLAKEFNPYTLPDWCRYLAIVSVVAGAALIVGMRDRKSRFLPLAVALAALCFGLLTVKSLRFTEYFVPFSVFAAAIALRGIGKQWLAPALFGASLLYLLLFGTGPLEIIASKKPYLEAVVADRLEQAIPEGSQVFTCGWDYTGNLMLVLPERRFLVAADPTLFYKKNPELYSIWHRMPLDAPLDSAEAIRQLFHSRFVVCRNFEAYWPFFDTLEKDPGVKTLYADRAWVFFDLGNGDSPMRARHLN